MMKRLVRNPEKFEALEVFTAFSRKHDYKLKSPEDTEKFLEQFGKSLKASQENQILLHGKRMEACFGQIAAGLHGCSLIKTEDTGDVISDDADILLPVAILVDNVDTTTATQRGGVYLMGQFNQNSVIHDASWTLAELKTALRSYSIFLEDSIQAPV